jgi:formamidopyrimidine-DNA glycosylase
MIELPEAIVLSQQINETIKGKRIMNVIAANSPHKFAWYYGDPQNYHDLLTNKVIGKSTSYGGLDRNHCGRFGIVIWRWC